MYTVKKFNPGEPIHEIKLNDNTTAIWRAKKRIFWVVMKDNEPVFTENLLTGKKELESYNTKQAAQKQADWYNGK